MKQVFKFDYKKYLYNRNEFLPLHPLIQFEIFRSGRAAGEVGEWLKPTVC